MTVAKTEFIQVQLQTGAESRTENFLGRPFRVIPAVLVRSQVLHNNLGAMRLPADDITDDWAEMWNGIPVLVGPHPSVRGRPVSGRSPQLLNARGAGWIFNASADSENAEVRRLKGEVWLDLSRVDVVDGLAAVLQKVDAGEPVELSTGFPAQVRQSNGTFQGEEYEALIHPMGADHLVISTEMTGACGVLDGCGLGVNERETTMDEPNKEKKERGWKAMLSRVSEMLGVRDDAMVVQWEDNQARQLARELTEARNAVTPSDQERANMIRAALQSKIGAMGEVIVTDVFSSLNQVIYWLHTPTGSMPPGAEYFRVSFTEEEGGAFTFSEPEKVRRMTSYEPSAQNAAVANSKDSPCGCHKEEAAMQDNEKKEIVAELTTAVQGLLKPVSDRLEAVANEAKAAAETAVNAVKAEFETALNAVKAQVDAVANAVNAEKDKERQALVAELSTNEKTKDVYSQADLEAMNLDQLRKVAQLAQVEVANYSGRGAPRAPVTNAEDGAVFAEPVPYFTNNKKQDAKEGE